MENKKKNLIRSYFRWPFYLGILLVVLSIAGFFIELKLGLYLLAAAAVFYGVALITYFLYRKQMQKKLVDFGAAYAQAQNQLLRQIDIPFAMCTASGDVIWRNAAFSSCFSLEPKKDVMLSSLFPVLENANYQNRQEYHVDYEDRRFKLMATPLKMDELHELNELGEAISTHLYNIYLIDETDLLEYKQTLDEERNVMGLIYLDNYEEVMAGVEYVRRSLLAALVERKLNKYVSTVKGLIRKLEKDRFLIVLKQEALWKLQEEKFSLLEDVKTVNIGNDMAITISMGIGIGGDSIEQNYDYARAAIDMALGRGGDQVVLKDGNEIHYYGGNVKTTERSTRVKARIKAQALRELIEGREAVMIMGHPISDLDCIGAAMGIHRAAVFSGKRVHIVAEDVSNSVRPLMKAILEHTESEELFIGRNRALELFDNDTLLVVVDTNRPSYTQCPDLLKRAKDVVVMDHHRQGREVIENAVLSYVEPYASSASEMVAEVIQYYDENLKLRPFEADAVFAGIVMDTNNFEDKSGVRTFEAAAYLRRCGADVTRVRKLFRDSMDDYKLRAETINRAELFEDGYIISICPSDKENRNQTVVAAQSANELLEVQGIKASFVLTEYDGRIYISARSIDEVNVQVLMEKLGGGGHASVAGAQLSGTTMDEAVKRLKDVILAMKELK